MQREWVAFFLKHGIHSTKVKKKKEKQKKGLDCTKKLVDVLYIPGKTNQLALDLFTSFQQLLISFNFNS